MSTIDKTRDRYPFCIVWTPIPILTWLFPIIGHMGENNMAFGRPTKYWQLTPSKVNGGVQSWDHGVTEASEIYKGRMHNLFCDNCHSHVATALNIMNYNNSTSWNMVKLAFLTAIYSKY
ncbi:Protein of unknown function (DUF778) [Popillia japonica]|uniref:Transmembrane protein 222 n=1 Tax=Popillia japonica TaxID=7064 RepID=A0AAW1KLU2_POPJA